ncbi:MAG: S8 family peptidase [Crocinitomicaceae bacterium]
MLKIFSFLLFVVVFSIANAQRITSGGVSFQKYAQKQPTKTTDFAVKGQLIDIKKSKAIHYKYSHQQWHFIRCSSTTLSQLMADGIITQVYFTPSAPRVLNDSMRLAQNIDSAYFGASPLQESYTGAGVVMGYIDDGMDYTHGDFLNEDGTTRVIRYWDQGLPVSADRTPEKYGYGQVWTNTELDAGLHVSSNGNAHGSTVAGTGSGNGAALNGVNRGAAPNCDIIMIQTDFSLVNWTLTVADAIDYVFSVADSLGKPAVVNTSVGDYLGSHDGTDPASQIIDSLLQEKNGRIVVAAAGNSGNLETYHVKGNVNPDTTMVWFEVNPVSFFGFPAVFFDLWADTANFKNVEFAFTAIDPSSSFEEKGRTQYFNIQSLLNMTTNDSIMVNGSKASNVEFYCEEVNGVYHIELLMENPDSSDYLYGFHTAGLNGTYDLWSGKNAFWQLSRIRKTNLPSVTEYPNIINYQFPDSLYSTVSSWTCSEQVITVANYGNQKDYIDQNGDIRVINHTSGKLSINSSKGPNRIGEQKPDISATGDGTLSSCPGYQITAMINSGSSSLAEGKQHCLNGGTSMASPVIAGIAALYLEKCSNASNIDFKNEVLLAAHEDTYTGTTPNYAYGHGKLNAFKLLNNSNFKPSIFGDTLICNDTALVSTIENNFNSYLWQDSTTASFFSSTEGDTTFVMAKDDKGCRGFSDTLVVIKGTMPIPPEINIIGGGLVATPAFAHQWFINNALIVDETEQFHNPVTSGDYYVTVTSKEGCKLTSEKSIINIETIKELQENEFIVFPNPFVDAFQIIKNDAFDVKIALYDIAGKKIYELESFSADDLFLEVNPPQLPAGVYLLQLQFENNFKIVKLIKE